MRIATAIELGTGEKKELVSLGDKFQGTTVVGLAVEPHEHAGLIAKVFYNDGGVRYSNPGISNVYTNMVENVKDLLKVATVGKSTVILDPKAKSFAIIDWEKDPEDDKAWIAQSRPVSGEAVTRLSFLKAFRGLKKEAAKQEDEE